MQKILIILILVLSIAAAGLGFLNRRTLLKERSDYKDKITELETSNKKAMSSAADLKKEKDKNTELSAQIEKNAAENKDLKDAKEKALSDVAAAQKQCADKDGMIAQQKTDLAAKDAHIAELEAKGTVPQAAAANKTDDDLKKQLDEKTLLTVGLQAKLKDQEAQLSQLRERENMIRNNMMRKGLEGKILAVNPSWNFVILNLGDRNGVVNNAEMLINRMTQRGPMLIGKVRITSVEPSTSIADIVVNSVRQGTSVQPGDTVIYSGPGDDSDAKVQ